MAVLSSDGKKILSNYCRFTGVPFNATIYNTLPVGVFLDNAVWFKNRPEYGGGYCKRDYEGAINALWYGLKGVGDETLIIQFILDTIPNGSVLDFKDLNLKVSKNLLLNNYPNGDQPCVALRNKRDITINFFNSTITVNTHAQGILEITNSSRIQCNNIIVVGAGDFPPIDGVTGRGEKGISGQGYWTSGFWGYYKNNSYPTDNRNTGGFAGIFPQYSGGTGVTWGVWKGGYIGNVSYGILFNNDCEDVTLNACKASGFNYVWIGVGHNGNFFPVDLGYAESRRITFYNCEGVENYEAGSHALHVSDFKIIGGERSRNGHPNSDPFIHAVCDPGYGHTNRNSSHPAKDELIQGVKCIGNKRKGLDSHSGENIRFLSNTIKDSPICGIFSAWSSDSQMSRGVSIKDNYIENCGFGPGSEGSVYIGGQIDAEIGDCNANVEGNVFEDYSSVGIWARYANNVNIKGNILGKSKVGRVASKAAILVQGEGFENLSRNINLNDNIIKDSVGAITRGIQTSFLDKSTVSFNKMEYKTDINIGLISSNCLDVDFFGNKATLLGKGTPIVLTQTTGSCEFNRGFGGDVASSLYPNTKGSLGIVKSIQFSIEFNGTANPILTKNIGGDHVGAFVPSTTQLQIALSAIGSGVINTSANTEVTSASGLKTANTFIGSIKVVTLTSLNIILEFKETPNLGSARINPANILSGKMNVLININ